MAYWWDSPVVGAAAVMVLVGIAKAKAARDKKRAAKEDRAPFSLRADNSPSHESKRPAARTLTRWQRLGVVLSVLWAIGAFIYTRHVDVERAIGPDSLPRVSYRICEGMNADTEADVKRLGLPARTGRQDCTKFVTQEELTKSLRVWAPMSNAVFMALAPIPLGWLAVWLVVRVARWIHAGPAKASAPDP